MPGPQEVHTIATGVSAHAELFTMAAATGADALLVHHGLFWGTGVTSLDDTLKRRLQILFDAGIALLAYHLPLDAHPEVGFAHGQTLRTSTPEKVPPPASEDDRWTITPGRGIWMPKNPDCWLGTSA